MTQLSKRLILFVDDEPEVLHGLKCNLRRERTRWDMIFAHGGAEAVSEIDRLPIDVIVTDMQMPDVDGAAVLRYSKAKRPEASRLVLTGQADERLTIEAIPITHQWLSKPCPREELVMAIERACAAKDLLADPALHRIVGGLSNLPSVPGIYAALSATLTDPDTSIETVSRLIEHDAAMTARFLQMANSSFFALSRVITDVREAVAYLGFNTVSQIVLGTEALESLRDGEGVPGLTYQHIQLHSFMTAAVAASLMEELKQPVETAMTAGLLHNIGLLVLLKHQRMTFAQALNRARSESLDLFSTERELFEITHAKVGAGLLSAWGLPSVLIEAVAYHDAPEESHTTHFDVAGVIHTASALVDFSLREQLASYTKPRAPLSGNYLEQHGVRNRLDAWLQAAYEIVAEHLASSQAT